MSDSTEEREAIRKRLSAARDTLHDVANSWETGDRPPHSDAAEVDHLAGDLRILSRDMHRAAGR